MTSTLDRPPAHRSTCRRPLRRRRLDGRPGGRRPRSSPCSRPSCWRGSSTATAAARGSRPCAWPSRCGCSRSTAAWSSTAATSGWCRSASPWRPSPPAGSAAAGWRGCSTRGPSDRGGRDPRGTRVAAGHRDRRVRRHVLPVRRGRHADRRHAGRAPDRSAGGARRRRDRLPRRHARCRGLPAPAVPCRPDPPRPHAAGCPRRAGSGRASPRSRCSWRRPAWFSR